ncbi:M48 family metallopeptidase [Pelagicoccus sp. SDUM812002]|uniref:M48 family metallopeptidase n=1 Tax=Pelagicoccus sp. SDUM812002 TaxID=3041266 RepID=UPI00280E5A31|nr:M48 family metallopeptidase [Pelagicoccus sp. SDUM812002]MDQ8186309.1 M48 family metallopeptidase [Pelagicoccus sp. SDUM812002]
MVDQVEGGFYAAGSSRSVKATLRLLAVEEFELSASGRNYKYRKGQYLVEPALGSLPRVVHFKAEGGDSRFETSDLLGFRELERGLTSGKLWSGIAWLEGHWKGTVASVVLLAFFCVAFLQWGLPALAWKVAQDMPQSWRVAMTDQSIESMERFNYLGESVLPVEEQARVQAIFAESLDFAGLTESVYDYELRIFAGKSIGANAFAFPSGLVVATDEFIRLCESDEQIQAVFLHELAHVEQQHGIRGLVQRGGVFIVFSILVGDASSAISLAEGIPALVMNSQYSQRFEMESDTFAAQILELSGIGAEAMEEVLILLHKDAPEVPVAAFLSSHPSLRERVENLRQIQAAGE